MSTRTDTVIVQNDTNVNLTQVVIVMSPHLNGSAAREIVPLFNDREVSRSNPLPPGSQAQREVSNLNRRFRYARFIFRFGTGPELSTGPYTTPGNDRFIQQIRLAVVRTDGRYVQVQIEDQKPFALLADVHASEFNDNDHADSDTASECRESEEKAAQPTL